jgi:precorrin-2 methylase
MQAGFLDHLAAALADIEAQGLFKRERQIAAPHVPHGIAELAIRMNIGDGRFPKDDVYDGAAATIAKAAEDGKQVTVLCEGDPFFYGSFMYLFARLADRCRVEVVPGVSSLMACATVMPSSMRAGTDTARMTISGTTGSQATPSRSGMIGAMAATPSPPTRPSAPARRTWAR